MPGFELINKKQELKEIKKIFDLGAYCFDKGLKQLEINPIKLKNLKINLRRNLNQNFP